MTYTWAGNSASPNNYRVRPVGALGGHVEFEAANPRPASPEQVGGDIQVASFNVLNYFNSFSGCRAGCRGADNAMEFERQADKIVAALAEMDADVVGLIEIENDGYAPDSAIADLTNRLNEVAGEGTYAYVDADAGTGEVDALGDDAIKVGMLYKPAVVELVGTTAALNSEEFVTGGDSAPRNRPALAQTFEDEDRGRFTVVVNHLKSKGSECDEPDDGDGQANCNHVRTRAAQVLADWLATDPTGSDDTDVLIVGDLNSYAKEDPIDVLKEAGYKDLVRRFEGKDAYSYVFDGQWGYLDHALASPHLARQVTGTTTWHINADEPSVLDYNVDFKSDAQVADLYAPTPYRSSDHDPVLVGLELAPSKPGADRTGKARR
jgi:predicted extracellular nuclease